MLAGIILFNLFNRQSLLPHSRWVYLRSLLGPGIHSGHGSSGPVFLHTLAGVWPEYSPPSFVAAARRCLFGAGFSEVAEFLTPLSDEDAAACPPQPGQG